MPLCQVVTPGVKCKEPQIESSKEPVDTGQHEEYYCLSDRVLCILKSHHLKVLRIVSDTQKVVIKSYSKAWLNHSTFKPLKMFFIVLRFPRKDDTMIVIYGHLKYFSIAMTEKKKNQLK